MRLKARTDNGIIQARVKTPAGTKRLSLGTRSMEEASRIAATANLATLEKVAAGGALARRALNAIVDGGNNTLQSLSADWLQVNAACGQSPLGIEKNRAVLHTWFAEHPEVAKLRPDALTESHINTWINSGTDGRASRIRRLSVLRSFCKFLVARGVSAANPAANIRVNLKVLTHEQRESRAVLAVTEAEYKRLDRIAPRDFWRDAFAIAWATGLRIGDVIKLEWATLTEPGHIIVWHEKTHERVCLPISERTTPGLAAVIARLEPNDKPHVFPREHLDFTFDEGGRARFSVYATRWMKRAGIEGKSFHSLRRARIQAWEAAGFSLDQCRRYAGHKNVETTKRYLRART